MRVEPFVLQSPTEMRNYHIMASDLNLGQCRELRAIVANNHTLSPDYVLKEGTGAFLQGYQEPRSYEGSDGWVLVEFWSESTTKMQSFVDHINEKMRLGQKVFRVTIGYESWSSCGMENAAVFTVLGRNAADAEDHAKHHFGDQVNGTFLSAIALEIQ